MQVTEDFSLHKNYICETLQENNHTLNIFSCILLMKEDFHIKKMYEIWLLIRHEVH